MVISGYNGMARDYFLGDVLITYLGSGVRHSAAGKKRRSCSSSFACGEVYSGVRVLEFQFLLHSIKVTLGISEWMTCNETGFVHVDLTVGYTV